MVLNHKDRLLRFDAELVFTLCELQGMEVVVIHQEEQPGCEEELAQDVLEIIRDFFGPPVWRWQPEGPGIGGDPVGYGGWPGSMTEEFLRKSHRMPLRPTPEQESLFQRHAGDAAFAYKWAVDEFRAGLEADEGLSERRLRPGWNRVGGIIAPWGREPSQNAAKYAIIDLGQAISNWRE